jgi:hypothetical protein
MPNVTLDHFERAVADISAHGDNDTLPFDIDNRFISENQNELAKLAFRFCHELEKGSRKSARNAIEGLTVYSEHYSFLRALPGSVFRPKSIHSGTYT